MLSLLLLAAALLAQEPSASGRMQNRVITLDGVGKMTYGISVPAGYRQTEPRPLILALHPGGPRVAYYGSTFARQVVQPALSDLGAIVVAPDCPARGWNDPVAEKAVTELLNQVFERYAIDRSRVLVTGFSMGGRGAWFMASRHPDLFTAAIPMASFTGDEPLDRLATMPTYVIHSRDDQVVPFAPAEQTARELERLGRVIRFEDLQGIGHYEMGGYVEALERAGRWIVQRWAAAVR